MNKIRQGIRIAIVASLFLLTLSLFLLFLAEYRNAALQRKDAEKLSQINRILEEHQRDISSADDAVAVLAEHGVSDLSLLQREGQIFFRNSDKKCYSYLSMQSKTAGMTLDELLYSEIDLFSEREEVIYFYLAETWRTEYVLLTKDIDMAELRRSVGEPILQIRANLAECSTLQSFLTETVFYDGEAYRYRLRKDAFYREEVEDVCSEDFYGFRLVILEGVDAIGDGAFAGSCFSEVQMSDDALSIGAGAFRECCFLRSARFSERLEEVGEGAFSGCLRLESISVEKTIQITLW